MIDPHRQKYAGNLRGLMFIGLMTGLALAYGEIKAIWAAEQSAAVLNAPQGTAAILVYAPLGIWAVTVLVAGLRGPGRILPLHRSLHAQIVLRWSVPAVLFIFIIWFHLYSAWQDLAPGPWTQFLVAAGLARFIRAVHDPQPDEPFGWSDLALTFSLFLVPGVVKEIRIIFSAEAVSHGAALTGILALMAIVALLYAGPGRRLRSALFRWRARIGRPRRVLIAVLLLTPLLIRYGVGAGFYILYPHLCFTLLLAALCTAAYLICRETDRLVSLESIAGSGAVLVLVSAITRSLLLVVDHPFSLSWSEGNRLYDYSLVFAQDLYNYAGPIPDPYGTPGRYGLWGVLFLWKELPIWVHRLWNVVLLTAPSFLLGWALTRKLEPAKLQLALFVWISAFFILLAPLHPPFMLAAFLVALFAFHPSPYVRAASLVAASLYAGLSRWTWVAAPGAWGALIDLLLYYPRRTGSRIQRLLPAVLMALLGFLPGFLINTDNFFGYTSGELGTAQQPLLWYRLLPNSTLGPGILLLALLTTGPLLALVLHKIWTRQWPLDGFQLLAVGGALLGFLGLGLVISTKIGGGGDLHNLDMFIVTLMFVAVLGLASHRPDPDLRRWPAWALALLCLLAFLPAYPFTPFHPSAGYHAWLEIPSRQETSRAIEMIRVEVDRASQSGEVLFMDQRQLLTFGQIRGVPFVPEYEKKYMMDQALASNAAYFQPYYRDLAAQRFSLIITEPLRVNIKGGEGVFADENDLWVIWISAPTLCYYEPLITDRAVGVQLLVPRANPAGCEQYLQQASQ